jgi:peptidoglycan/xylan/chitin deacetylase (PgdA/CDA1 family)
MSQKKLVAFTYDDGPVDWNENSTAMRILNTLKKYNQHATFFYCGEQVDSLNVKEILFAKEIGCEIANHTWSHQDLTRLTEEDFFIEVNKSKDKLKEITGKNPSLFRFPYLACDETTIAAVQAPSIGCSVDTRDWDNGTKESVMIALKEADTKGTLENSIVLMHENIQGTAAAMEVMIPYLIEQGYQMVTVSELAAYHGIDLIPGQVYNNF